MRPDQDPRQLEYLGTIIKNNRKFTYYRTEKGEIRFEDEPIKLYPYASLLTTDMNAAKTRYKKVAAQVAYTAASWKYISKCFVDPALGIMVPTETKAGSTTGLCNGLYTD